MFDDPRDDERPLDFPGVLAELHRFVGERVVVESSAVGGWTHHESHGLLAGSIDLQVQLGAPVAGPAHIAFELDSGARFVLRERQFEAAYAYEIFDHKLGAVRTGVVELALHGAARLGLSARGAKARRAGESPPARTRSRSQLERAA